MTQGNGQGAPPGAIARQDFGGSMTQSHGETAAMAIAAQAKAAVEARWIVAMRQPRNMDQVRADLLRECKRPSFAEVARYRKPVGQGVEGLSIRFVEAAIQALGNILTDTIVIYDDDEKRILSVTVTDLEKNVTHPKQVTVTKRVERRNLRKGQTALGRRTNSYGDTVYIVAASDDDLLNKEGALVSKALRTCGLRLIPGWLQDECEKVIKATLRDETAKDPDAEKRRLLDAFTDLGVQPEGLAQYIGHDLDALVPAELVELREIYTTIRDGQATWADVLEHKLAQRGEEAPEQAQDPAKAGKGTEAVKAKLATKRPTMRPSRSKGAQAVRERELKDQPVGDERAAKLYIQNGDPRNKAKALYASQGSTQQEMAKAGAESEEDYQAAKARSLEAQAAADVAERDAKRTAGAPPHDPETGEVHEDLPDWANE